MSLLLAFRFLKKRRRPYGRSVPFFFISEALTNFLPQLSHAYNDVMDVFRTHRLGNVKEKTPWYTSIGSHYIWILKPCTDTKEWRTFNETMDERMNKLMRRIDIVNSSILGLKKVRHSKKYAFLGSKNFLSYAVRSNYSFK